MNYTAHSETGKIKTLFIKHADNAFVNDENIEQYWKNLNYTSKPLMQNASVEYQNFESILKEYADEIFYLPQDENVNIDSIYCRDAAITTNGGMIICNMGKAARGNEPAAEKKAFAANGINVLGEIKFPGTVEGGDVAWLDEHTLAVGHSYRTNEEGIKQLTAFLKPLNVEVLVAELPHYKGKSDVLHLMSILSPVDADVAVVYSPLMSITFRNILSQRGIQLIEVPDAEFDSMGSNVLALAPRVCLMTEGNPQTKNALENAGCKVITYKGDDISVKGCGGPTCLTRPVFRYK